MARSAAYVLAIVALTAGLIGALILTVMDPIAQHLFASSLYDSSTSYGTDALSWQQDAWTYWPAFILFGIMLLVWIVTRRPE